MSNLNVEVCPETGMCSIVRGSTDKADLMPDEVEALRKVKDDPAQIRAILAASDATFAASLSDRDLRQIAATVG